jgi:hypothetical protein
MVATKPSVIDISKSKSYSLCHTAFRSADISQKLATYESVVLGNGDVCSVGNWVLVVGDGSTSAVCCVEEIVSLMSNDEVPGMAQGILLNCGAVGDFLDPYHMPAIKATNEFLFLPPAVCSIIYPSTRFTDSFPGSAVHCKCSTQLYPTKMHGLWL